MKRSLPAILLAIVLAPALTQASPDAPNDPRFGEQWALTQVGAQCAWATTLGSPDVTVAVVDSGVDLGHPDLVDRLRTDGRDFVDGDADAKLPLGRLPWCVAAHSQGAANKPTTKARRQATSPSTRLTRPPRMPLMPAMRPFHRTSTTLPRPIRTPPDSACQGVKLLQSMFMGNSGGPLLIEDFCHRRQLARGRHRYSACGDRSTDTTR